MKVGFISLGCNKNLVDTEKTISIFKENNYEIVNNPKEAEIIVINTCGFIESAKEEAINTILEMAEYKKQKCKYQKKIHYFSPFLFFCCKCNRHSCIIILKSSYKSKEVKR